jgi:hypothetical protein
MAGNIEKGHTKELSQAQPPLFPPPLNLILQPTHHSFLSLPNHPHIE